MPKTKPMTPAVRSELQAYLVVSIETYLRELTLRYFRRPADADARQLLLESIALALQNLTAADLTGRATLLTFANELIDKESQQ